VISSDANWTTFLGWCHGKACEQLMSSRHLHHIITLATAAPQFMSCHVMVSNCHILKQASVNTLMKPYTHSLDAWISTKVPGLHPLFYFKTTLTRWISYLLCSLMNMISKQRYTDRHTSLLHYKTDYSRLKTNRGRKYGKRNWTKIVYIRYWRIKLHSRRN